jgi:3'-phosphoadenosine 5'-phosphosulfate sulfotransferase (PAPS reductase)/FAD synthetase
MVRESGIDPKTIVATFCDTDNEHRHTYDYIRMLSSSVHPITWIYPQRGFFELSKHKQRFPSPIARFCTTELKIKPTLNWLARLRARGWDKIVMASGVRAAESLERSKLVEREERDYVIEEWRPLLKWTLEDVWAIHRRHDIKPNPLYALGSKRVGCFPCIMSRKQEIAAAFRHSPEVFDRIRDAEKPENFSGRKAPRPFFAYNKTPKRFHSVTFTTKKGKIMTLAMIDDVISWATEKPDFVQGTLPLTELKQDAMDHNVCPSNLGYCE